MLPGNFPLEENTWKLERLYNKRNVDSQMVLLVQLLPFQRKKQRWGRNASKDWSARPFLKTLPCRQLNLLLQKKSVCKPMVRHCHSPANRGDLEQLPRHRSRRKRNQKNFRKSYYDRKKTINPHENLHQNRRPRHYGLLGHPCPKHHIRIESYGTVDELNAF